MNKYQKGWADYHRKLGMLDGLKLVLMLVRKKVTQVEIEAKELKERNGYEQ